MNTSSFLVISILFCLGGFLVDNYAPHWLYIIASISYIIYCVRVFKKLKVRFLSYPVLVFSLFISFFFCYLSGAKGGGATGLAFLLIFGFMFWLLPLMVIPFVVGAIIDIIEFMNKRKSKTN